MTSPTPTSLSQEIYRILYEDSFDIKAFRSKIEPLDPSKSFPALLSMIIENDQIGDREIAHLQSDEILITLIVLLSKDLIEQDKKTIDSILNLFFEMKKWYA